MNSIAKSVRNRAANTAPCVRGAVAPARVIRCGLVASAAVTLLSVSIGCSKWPQRGKEIARGNAILITANPLGPSPDFPGVPSEVASLGQSHDTPVVVVAMSPGSDLPLTRVVAGRTEGMAKWGSGPGELRGATALVLAGHQLLVLDPVRRIVATFDESGAFRAERRLPASLAGIPVLGSSGAVFTLNSRSGIATIQYVAPSGELKTIPTGLTWRKGASFGALLQVSPSRLLAFRDRDGCLFGVGLQDGAITLAGCLPSALRSKINRVGQRVFGPIANRLVGHEAPAVPFRFLGGIDSSWAVLGFEEPGFMPEVYALDLRRWILHEAVFVDGTGPGHRLTPTAIGSGAGDVLLADDQVYAFRLPDHEGNSDGERHGDR